MSFLSCSTKWLICTICMERQSNSYGMKAHVERCSGIIAKTRETADINVYTPSWSKQKHNELKSTNYADAQSLFHITENNSDGNAGNTQKRHCDLILSHTSHASFFKKKFKTWTRGQFWLIDSKFHFLAKMLTKLFFNCFAKLMQETKSIRSRALFKGDIDFIYYWLLCFMIFQGKKVSILVY